MVSTNVGMTRGRIGGRSLWFLSIEYITLYGSQLCVTYVINLTLGSTFTKCTNLFPMEIATTCHLAKFTKWQLSSILAQSSLHQILRLVPPKPYWLLIVNRLCCATHNNCKASILGFSLYLGIIHIQCCNNYHLLSDFSSKLQPSTTISHYKIVRMQNVPNFVLAIDMEFTQISIIHDNTRKLIHKKCHQISYRSDIECRMTLITIFNVATVHWLPQIVCVIIRSYTML